MTEPPGVTAVGHLVLARLLVAGDKGATLPQIKKDVGPLVEHRWTGASWNELLDRTLDSLEASNWLRRIKPLRGKTVLFRATPAGIERGYEFLRIAELPPKATWASLKKTFLLARAIGLSAPRGEALRKFAGDAGFKAALLKAEFDLPIGDYPTAKEAADALCWKLVGLESNARRKFDLKSLLAALFDRELGEHRQGTPQKEVDKLLARKLSARRSDAKEFRNAALRHWIDRATMPAAPDELAQDMPPPPAHATGVDGEVPLNLDTFAERVLAAAGASRSGRFGDKVYIAQLWRVLEGDRATAGMDLDTFKRRLAEANQARLLDLSRADLVEAMDPDLVRESETRFLGATYHFVGTRVLDTSA